MLSAFHGREQDPEEEGPSDDALVGGMLLWEIGDLLRWMKRALQG